MSQGLEDKKLIWEVTSGSTAWGVRKGRKGRLLTLSALFSKFPLWPLGLTCGVEDTPHLSQLRERELGYDAPTYLPARSTLWPIGLS